MRTLAVILARTQKHVSTVAEVRQVGMGQQIGRFDVVQSSVSQKAVRVAPSPGRRPDRDRVPEGRLASGL
jgi:hypothetical protein